MTSRVVHLSGADRIDSNNNGADGLERACLEVIAVLSERREPVATPQVIHWMRARALAPSVVLALQRLEQKRLITRDDVNIVQLTDEGAAAGARILRRRRLLERFLNDTLKVPWHEVYREAKHLEPILSPVMEARVEALTAQATTCPYATLFPDAARRIMTNNCWSPRRSTPGSLFRASTRKLGRIAARCSFSGRAGCAPERRLSVVLTRTTVWSYSAPTGGLSFRAASRAFSGDAGHSNYTLTGRRLSPRSQVTGFHSG